MHENEKKRMYSKRVMEIEQGTFTPLVFTTTGGMGNECLRYHSRLAELIAIKKDVELNVFFITVTASKNLHEQMYDAVIRVSTYFFDTNPIGRSPVFTHFSSTLDGISTIRSLSCQNLISKELSTCQDRHTEAWFLFLAASRWFAYRLEFLCFLFVAMAAFTPLFIAEKQRIDEGIVGLSLTYAIVLTGMFQWCVRVSAEVENQMTSVERVFEYCALEPEGTWTEPTYELSSAWPVHGIITAERLSLQYHPTLPRALKNVYFCIRAKEKVGIVGRTGAGKSSLMAALLRIAEPSGRLLIDGVDITDIGLHDLRSRISVIPQDPVLFGGTLRYNLDPFNEYCDKDLWIALKEVGLRHRYKLRLY
ncbi:hypothetical protein QZH41_000006 [Actinostola sp. cb2023]|nr:hypothetical protein QZH41_000006 [Actinostola sp. cb2023]